MPDRPTPRHRAHADESSGPRKHWRSLVLVVFVLAVIGVGWNMLSAAPAEPVPLAKAGTQFALGPGALPQSPGPEGPQQRSERIAALKNDMTMAVQTLCSYQTGTIYPPESRPITEHPDQVYPNQPVEDIHAMRT